MRSVSIWDGVAFKDVPEDEAADMVKNDRAQYTHLAYSHLKFRSQFTGYQTREMRAEAPAPVVAAPVVAAPEVEELDWKSYRKKAGKAIGKATLKVTKADVEAYLDGTV